MSLTSKRVFEFGDFRLKTGARLLELNGRPVPLGSKAFEVLTCLVIHAGSVVTKDNLLKEVWPESFVEEGNLSQQIFALRRALGDHAGFIVTVPGRGYQFTERVTEVSEQATSMAVESGSFVVQRTRERAHIVIEETSTARSSAPPATEPLDGAISQVLERSPASTSLDRTGTGLDTMSGSWSSNAISTSETEETGWRNGRLALPPPPGVRVLWYWMVPAMLLLGGGIIAARYMFRAPANQRVVIAELENHTQDPGLSAVLRNALQIDLDQSPYIDVMSESEALSTIKLMDRKPDTAMVPEVAREICRRSNRQVLISGSIASVGDDYLLTFEATDCESGKILAGTKAEITSKDQVLAALDTASASLRKSLGESSTSLERFQVPIAQATTSSLEALEQYSIGEYQLGRMGKEEADVLPFFERAVELDPQFAMAQVAVATAYYSLGEYALADPYYQRAFNLSGQVSEKERLYIRAHYYSDDKRDIRQGLAVYAMWADTYPKDWGPWIDMADERSQLGQYPEALEAAQHALKIDSSRGIIYAVLARTYMHMNRFADAESTAERAFSLGKDSNMLHATLLEIALAQKDEPAIERELAWSHGKEGEWNFLDLEARSAAQEGRFNAAKDLFQAAYNSALGESLPEKANGILLDEASAFLDAGLGSVANDAIQRITKKETAEYLPADPTDDAEVKRSPVAYFGSGTADMPDASVNVTRLRAQMALHQGKPSLAIADLQGSTEYEFSDGYSTTAGRADADRLAGQPARAAEEYQQILENPGVDPVSPLIPLARLGLARAESQEGHTKESMADYQILFEQWRKADADLPVLLAARKEYLLLTSPH